MPRKTQIAGSNNDNVIDMPSAETAILRAAIDRRPVMHEEIAQRAYEIYELRGGTNGSDITDWLQAEFELRSEESQLSVA